MWSYYCYNIIGTHCSILPMYCSLFSFIVAYSPHYSKIVRNSTCTATYNIKHNSSVVISVFSHQCTSQHLQQINYIAILTSEFIRKKRTLRSYEKQNHSLPLRYTSHHHPSPFPSLPHPPPTHPTDEVQYVWSEGSHENENQ